MTPGGVAAGLGLDEREHRAALRGLNREEARQLERDGQEHEHADDDQRDAQRGGTRGGDAM